MIRIAFCSLALIGFGNAAWAEPSNPDSRTRGSHESSATAPSHIPSSGLTMETLKALPRTPDAWYPPGSANHSWVYQPYAFGGVYPYYSFARPYRSYAYSYGMGGYYPPRVGGWSYPAVLGWWIW